ADPAQTPAVPPPPHGCPGVGRPDQGTAGPGCTPDSLRSRRVPLAKSSSLIVPGAALVERRAHGHALTVLTWETGSPG
ncbi:MAG: hypothetical protein ACRDQ9_11820, partial [Pseudonocardiaceae bacterium]